MDFIKSRVFHSKDILLYITDFLCVQDTEKFSRSSRLLFEMLFSHNNTRRTKAVEKITRIFRQRLPEMTYLLLLATNRLTKTGLAEFYALYHPIHMRERLIRLASFESRDVPHKRYARELLLRGGPFLKDDIRGLIKADSSIEEAVFIGW